MDIIDENTNKKGKKILIVLDAGILQSMFEEKEKEKEVAEKLSVTKNNHPNKIDIVTTMLSFLRAIYLSDSNTNIKIIQKVLKFVNIIPSFAEYNDDKKVRKELLYIAKIMTRGKKDDITK